MNGIERAIAELEQEQVKIARAIQMLRELAATADPLPRPTKPPRKVAAKEYAPAQSGPRWIPPPQMIPWAREMRKRLKAAPKTSKTKRDIYREVFEKTSESGVVYPHRAAEILGVTPDAAYAMWTRHFQGGGKA